MEGLLQFVNDNYIWLIIIAVVILFALIGYIADKNNFNNKKQNLTDTNSRNDQKVIETKVETNKKGKKVKQQFVEEIVSEEELEQIDETLMEEIEVNDEDLNLETEKVEKIEEFEVKEEKTNNSKTNNKVQKNPKIKEEVAKTTELNIDKDFNEVLEDVEEKSNEVNVEIPQDEDDIWKF